MTRKITLFTLLVVIVIPSLADKLKTPLEQSNYQSIPQSKKINEYLQLIASQSPFVTRTKLGISAGNRPVYALLMSKDKSFPDSNSKAGKRKKLTVMLVGSQHGNEPSGSEAMQVIAREIALGNEARLLEKMNIVMIAMANPDGRDLSSRYNAAKENPNIDYVAVNASETQLYIDVLNRFDPHVIYDAHESGIYKRVLSGQQGYMTHVEAQFEVGNNPNINEALRRYSETIFLPELIKQVNSANLPAQRYRGEITSLEQTVARGGIGITNFRNYAAMLGSLSVLVENRLDSKKGTYLTPRNIKARVDKQAISLHQFLALVADDASRILSITESAKTRSQSADTKIALDISFVENKNEPVVSIPLSHVKSGKIVNHDFTNHDMIRTDMMYRMPEAYVVWQHHEQFQRWLDKQHIKYQVIDKKRLVKLNKLHASDLVIHDEHLPGVRDFTDLTLRETPVLIPVRRGDIWVPMNQPKAVLAAAMLDPRSSTSVFQEPAWHDFLKEPLLPLYIKPSDKNKADRKSEIK